MSDSQDLVRQYTAMARVYDTWMEHDRPPYDKWADFISRTLEASRIPGRRVLEIGCGTGQITSRLHALGWTMIGIDASEDMVDIARRKYRGPQFVHMSLPDNQLLGLERFSSAIACFDTVNYLAAPGLLDRAFELIGQCLFPDALFIFDTNTQYKLETLFGKYYTGDDFGEFAYVWRNDYRPNERSCYIDLSFFIRDPDGRYERFTEKHVERWFSQDEIEAALTAGNFRLIRACAAYSSDAVLPDTPRITWIAKKLHMTNET